MAALAMVIGLEALLVLRDIRGLDHASMDEVSRWATRALLRASLQDSECGGPSTNTPSLSDTNGEEEDSMFRLMQEGSAIEGANPFGDDHVLTLFTIGKERISLSQPVHGICGQASPSTDSACVLETSLKNTFTRNPYDLARL